MVAREAELCSQSSQVRAKAGRSTSFAAARRLNPLRSTHQLNSGRLIAQDCQGEAVVITGLSVADLGLRLLELCLTQLNDGT